MWKLLMQRRIKKNMRGNRKATRQDIKNASTVLFSVFGRYGDSIIAFKAISEFMRLYPQKKYIVITSNRTLPYARCILGSNGVSFYSVNKRRNPIRLLGIILMLGKANVDLGFNPWSQGDDSRFFITYARNFSFFGSFFVHPKEYNLYRMAREYLLLDRNNESDKANSADNYTVKNIVISPFSTDITKSLDRNDLAALLHVIGARFPGAVVTIALQKNERPEVPAPLKKFFFGKNSKSSEEFLKLLKSTDLFIGVDAGPLHLADALGVRSIGIFGPTAPETVLDRGSAVIPLRLPELRNIFCFVRQCRKPVCISNLLMNNPFENEAAVDFNVGPLLEADKCPIVK